MPVNDSWNELPWPELEQDLFRLQKRTYQASKGGDYSSVRKLQNVLEHAAGTVPWGLSGGGQATEETTGEVLLVWAVPSARRSLER